ncbi:MAG TPA: hypothetical protein VHD60_00090 [Candidatus Saccharimonadales bacterium]|nr:hypothetical protein [Candidatus Saccharimonadales bacterium]
MKIRRLLHISTSLVVGVYSLMFVNLGTAFAAGNNCTWTGGGDGATFSDSANWSSCGSTVPQNGDSLVFPISALGTDYATLNNDLSGLSVNNITFSGANTWPNGGSTGDFFGLNIGGDALTITGNISNTTTSTDSTLTNPLRFDNSLTFAGNPTLAAGHGGLMFTGAIAGSGNITTTGDDTLYGGSVSFSGTGSTFSGTIDATSGVLSAATSSSVGTASLTVGDGASLGVGGCALGAATFSNDITLSGASSYPSGLEPTAKLGVGSVCFGGMFNGVIYSAATSDQAFTLTGHITLSTDVTFGGKATTTTLTGPFSGGHKFTLPGVTYGGKLVVDSSNNTSSMSNGTYNPAVVSKTLTGNHPDVNLYIGSAYAVSVDGVQGDTTVASGGTLEGSGSVGALTVNSGGTVAPGHSPGCLASGNLTLNGSYAFQIGGTTACSGYDQINVTGTVSISGALNVSLYNNYAPKTGESYTIIQNDGSDAVTGTFTGLAEGATFKVGADTFKISYKGSTGNDVVLTVVSAPAAPDTSYVARNFPNPIVEALGIGALGAIGAGLTVLWQNRKHKHQ